MTNELFRLIRIQKRLSQRDFAKRIGISKALVTMIETNKRPVTGKTASKVLRSLEITDSEIEAYTKLQQILEG